MKRSTNNEWLQMYGCDVDEVDLDSLLDLNQPLLPNPLLFNEPIPAQRYYSSQLRFTPNNSLNADVNDSLNADSDSGLATSIDSDSLSWLEAVAPQQHDSQFLVANVDEDIFADVMQTQSQTQRFSITLPSETALLDVPSSQRYFRFTQTQTNNSLADNFADFSQDQVLINNSQTANFADFSQASSRTSDLNNSSREDSRISYPIPKRISRYAIPKRGQQFSQLPLTSHVIPFFPESIKILYERIRSAYSDYAFAHAISAQMCQEILPMDAYVTLKQSLLLSIISVQVGKKKNK